MIMVEEVSQFVIVGKNFKNSMKIWDLDHLLIILLTITPVELWNFILVEFFNARGLQQINFRVKFEYN